MTACARAANCDSPAWLVWVHNHGRGSELLCNRHYSEIRNFADASGVRCTTCDARFTCWGQFCTHEVRL